MMACVGGRITRVGKVGLLANRLHEVLLSVGECFATSLNVAAMDATGITVTRRGTVGLSVGIICTIPVVTLFLEIEPSYLWLTEYNDYTDDVDVMSNVVWNVS